MVKSPNSMKFVVPFFYAPSSGKAQLLSLNIEAGLQLFEYEDLNQVAVIEILTVW